MKRAIWQILAALVIAAACYGIPNGPAGFDAVGVSGQTTIRAKKPQAQLNIAAGSGIALTNNTSSKTVTITATAGTTLQNYTTAHRNAADPHTGYYNQARGDARYQSKFKPITIGYLPKGTVNARYNSTGALYVTTPNTLEKRHPADSIGFERYSTLKTFSNTSTAQVRGLFIPSNNYVFASPFTRNGKVSTETGIYRSTNGSTFSKATVTPAMGAYDSILAFDEDATLRGGESNKWLYATNYTMNNSYNARIYRSKDLGANWTSVFYDADLIHMHQVKVAPNNTIYATTDFLAASGPPYSPLTGKYAVIKSTNGGDTWAGIYPQTPTTPQLTAIFIHPTKNYKLFGTDNPYKMQVLKDTGNTDTDLVEKLNVSTDQMLYPVVFTFNPTTNTIYFGTWGLTDIYASFDDGETWTKIASINGGDPGGCSNGIWDMSNFYNGTAVVSYSTVCGFSDYVSQWDNAITLTEGSTTPAVVFNTAISSTVQGGNKHTHTQGDGAYITADALSLGATCSSSNYIKGDLSCDTPAGGATYPDITDDSINKRVGINSTSPEGPLHVSTDAALANLMDMYYTGNNNPAITFRKARGSQASPSIVSADDAAGGIAGMVYDSTAPAGFRYVGAFKFFAEAQPNGATSHPGYFTVSTAPEGDSTFTEKFRVKSTGSTSVGDTSYNTACTNKLCVNGTGKFDGAVTVTALNDGTNETTPTKLKNYTAPTVCEVAPAGTIAATCDIVIVTSGASNTTLLPTYTGMAVGRIIQIQNHSGASQTIGVQSGEKADYATNGTYTAAVGATLTTKHLTSSTFPTSSWWNMGDGNNSYGTAITGTTDKALAFYNSSATAWQQTDGAGTDGLFWDDTNARVGVGTAAPAVKFHVLMTNNTPEIAEYASTTATNSVLAPIILRVSTSQDMTDGFGPALQFQVTDSGVTGQNFGQLIMARAGADNTADFLIKTFNAGSLAERFRVTAAGIGVFQGGGSANKATCWKSDGKTLGYCSTVVAADGSCTCN